MTIGPKHYEGWTCNECDYMKETTHFYCFEPSIIESKIDNRINDRDHTPSWCPYIKYAIMQHVVDES